MNNIFTIRVVLFYIMSSLYLVEVRGHLAHIHVTGLGVGHVTVVPRGGSQGIVHVSVVL